LTKGARPAGNGGQQMNSAGGSSSDLRARHHIWRGPADVRFGRTAAQLCLQEIGGRSMQGAAGTMKARTMICT